MRDLSASVFGTSSDEARLHWAGSALTMHLDAIAEADVGFKCLHCTTCIAETMTLAMLLSEHV
jgi:hypothetical protein